MNANFISLFILIPSIYGLNFIRDFFRAKSYHPNLIYYETLHSSQLNHHAIKRGLQESNNRFNKIEGVSFTALGRDFHLILNPRKGLLHPQFRAYAVDAAGDENLIRVDDENFYEGHVFGETASDVSVHLEGGIMTATIETPEDTYHVEPSWRHVPQAGSKEMIIYRGSDVKLSWDIENANISERHGVCGYIHEDSTVDGSDEEDEAFDMFEKPQNKERKEDLNAARQRVRRQMAHNSFIMEKSRCPLLLVADYKFFREMGDSNFQTTLNYLISLIDRVDKIYKSTTWTNTYGGNFSGIGYVIQKIMIHQEPTPAPSGQLHYNMQKDSWDVRTLLEVFSREYDHRNYCLAHLFTDTKFVGGILGLAYVGSPRRTSVGGICTPEYFKSGHTLYLNSGFSSSRNHYGQRVITREADLVTAHELGHNWGSEHDPDRPECSPSARQGGSYIMYTFSVSGYDINNKKFSPCSLRAIGAVLVAKSGRCFVEPKESYCGNRRVEGEEECDAGLIGQDDIDLCCDKHCKLRPSAVCSDQNSQCCQGCNYMSAGIKCRDEQPALCQKESLCTGSSADCPKADPSPDGTTCVERGQCFAGHCLPFCETQDMQSCMCDTVEDACKRCCRKSLNDTCFPVKLYDILPNGTPCIHGFCNEGKCEKTVQDIVERFWDIIEDIDINTLVIFIKDNVVGTVVVISVIIWIPASCVFSYVDHVRREEYKRKCEEYRGLIDKWFKKSKQHKDGEPATYKLFDIVVQECEAQHLLSAEASV